MEIQLPRGFYVAGLHCGMKGNPTREDLTLMKCGAPAVAAGVYTQNRVRAAPVEFCARRTPSNQIQAVVVNSGCANACTGDQGDRDTEQMARWTAQACGVAHDSVLVMSTGIIGELLPMEKLQAGIPATAEHLATDNAALVAAARGILTTDTVHKIAGHTLTLGNQTISITGIAKGSGMIGPNMATMLGLVMTDASLTPEDAQRLLGDVTTETFNCVSVDGHTSTNDTVLLLASGKASPQPLAGDELEEFRKGLFAVCEQLAKAIADDGEGATHLITVDVVGCASRQDAFEIAKAVANSPLVKTAIAGHDPNWGRIVSAAGYSGVQFAPAEVSLLLNETLLYEGGQPVSFNAVKVSESMRDQRDTQIVLKFRSGDQQCRFWTCDLTNEYVHINADYHT